jgi:hypothetical protein
MHAPETWPNFGFWPGATLNVGRIADEFSALRARCEAHHAAALRRPPRRRDGGASKAPRRYGTIGLLRSTLERSPPTMSSIA